MSIQRLLVSFLGGKFHILSLTILIYLLILYANLSVSFFDYVQINRTAYLVLCISMSVLYLLLYRFKTFFCYETIFFALFILCVFFDDIILSNVPRNVFVSSVYYTKFSSHIENKGFIVQMLAYFAFMTAAAFCNKKYKCAVPNIIWHSDGRMFNSFRYEVGTYILGLILAGYIVMLFLNGVITSWFHYSGNISNYTNNEVVYITVVCLTLSVMEMTRLNKKGCHCFQDVIFHVNKLVFFEVSFLFIVLLISGNRNESLLILLPAISAYSVLIKQISNKQFLLGLTIGVAALVFIGVIRQDEYRISSDMEIGLFEFSRDFGFVDPNTRYLIEYVDMHGPMYFNNAFLTFFSSVPFVGGIIASIFELSFDIRSPQLTTDGMQLASNMDSGLGTSLVGDLYYTGGFIFVMFFMILFGIFVASLHNRFVYKKDFNIWLVILYCFNLANVVYYIRAEWTMPFRYVGFSFVIILLLIILSYIFNYKSET